MWNYTYYLRNPILVLLFLSSTAIFLNSCLPSVYPNERRDTKYVKLLQSLTENEPEITIQQNKDTIVKTDLSHLKATVDDLIIRHEELKDSCEIILSLAKSALPQSNTIDLSGIIAAIKQNDSLSTLNEYMDIVKIALLSKGQCMVIVNSDIAKRVRITSHTFAYPLGEIDGQKAYLYGQTIIYAINGDEIYRVSNTDKKK
ncbi:MAG: hypothetical protein V4642_07825 [Bacteroidota bacterium]